MSSKSFFQRCRTFFRAMCPKTLTSCNIASCLLGESIGIRLSGCWAHVDGSGPWWRVRFGRFLKGVDGDGR